ncbi:MAG: rhamnogalacturonan acetylesterase [Prevotellaceae bacterium]|nr:rhamnogalacturonan acetylesterase [Prevotellaceae bacterium]
MRYIKSAVLLLAALFVLSAFNKDKRITIFMVGDSTMANKDISGGKVERGWGMMLCNYFSDDVVVDNHAKNGRSSKSFIDEGRWDKVLEKITPGDYVFIQFGHNDEKDAPARHTEPGTTFDANLRKYVIDAREKGGIPVLFNAVARRKFYREGDDSVDDESLRDTKYADEKINSDTLIDTHGLYLLSPLNVAKELNVPFVDANKITRELEQSMGPKESRKLHMWFRPGEEPSVPEGRQDNTHYNIYGANLVASLLVDEIARQVPALKKYVRHYDSSVASNGMGLYFSPQEAVDKAPFHKKTTILINEGTWKKPSVAKGKKIKFVRRKGARWE